MLREAAKLPGMATGWMPMPGTQNIVPGTQAGRSGTIAMMIQHHILAHMDISHTPMISAGAPGVREMHWT